MSRERPAFVIMHPDDTAADSPATRRGRPLREVHRAVVELCRERGILFVADEVQTGFARTGNLFGNPAACAAASVSSRRSRPRAWWSEPGSSVPASSESRPDRRR